jgi:hypothetical protein
LERGEKKMTFGNKFRWAAALSVFFVLFAAGLAAAQKTEPSLSPVGMAKTAPPMMTGRGRRDIDSGKHHEKNKGEGPVVDIWKMTQRRKLLGEQIIKNFGTANLALHADGSWSLSGQMNETGVGSDCRFYIVMAVKSAEGTSVLFSYSDVVTRDKPESYSWQKQGNNPTIKANFKSFEEKGHDWAGHWTCVPLPKAGNAGAGDPNWQRPCLLLQNAIRGLNCKPGFPF